jgi:hypothetical protein
MLFGSRRIAPFLVLLTSCVSTTKLIPAGWMSVPQATAIAAVSLDAEGKVTPSGPRLSLSPIRVESNRLFNADKALTDAFVAIDSFDFSASRGEVVFSAKRKDDFDIGLVSSDGSPVNWVPNDPADEIGVQWAPRGNKISYVIRAKGGDVVRTVHVPTAFELSNPFPNATIHALAWDPPAERYAVVYSTPDASDRVEILRYNGRDRRIAIEPAARLDVDIEPFARDAIVLRPRDVRYDEKLPVVLWVDESFAWNDARAALMNDARVAMIVSKRSPDEDLWRAVRETAWMDGSRRFVVAPRPPRSLVTLGMTIEGDPRVPDGHYRRDGNLVSVAPRVVQSFAAGFIADQLKRTTPPNASSR